MKAVGKSRSNGAASTRIQSARGPLISTSSASPPTTVNISGVPVHFPFQPYECQNVYMEKVLAALHRSENALLESPTGTGKTLCLLCATLAWQREQARSIPGAQQQQQQQQANNNTTQEQTQTKRVPTIIYASRTHSQLSQVVRELRNTRYRPKHAVLGSRDQMCVHPKVKTKTSTSSEVNHDCAKLGKERKCRFRNQLEGFVPPSNESGGANTQPVMDMEDLVDMGKTRKVCPFYYTRSLVSDAELVLVPYNYLFDKDARESTLAEIRWEDAVVIFDEAHNLESFASESASFDLTSVHIAGCIGEITRAVSYIQAMPELGERVRIDNLTKIKVLLLQFEEYLMCQIPNQAAAYSGEYIFEIFQKGASITHTNHNLFVQEIRKVSDLIMDVRGGGSSSGGGTSKGTPQLENFVKCVKLVFGEVTEARCLAKARTYRVHVTPKQVAKNNTGRTLSYWCFSPSLAMQELAALNLRSIIVTSGTLSPLPSYSMELGLHFPHTLENPHIIKKEQVHVRVIGRGVSGKVLSSTYERRESGEYVAELGNTIVSLARVIPGGLLIFFPSYGVMETCIERWGGPTSSRKNFGKKENTFFAARQKRSSSSGNQYSFPHAPNYYAASEGPSTPWKRILAQKAIVVEPRTASDLSDAIQEFHKFLRLPKSSGCVLIGVCRGKISEGIDFSDEMCRAVVITGIPFAPFQDPKVKLKREFLDSIRAGRSIKPKGDGGFGNIANSSEAQGSTTLSGAEWYSQQAHRAVNQAIGRVIRNKSDYGAVLLLDSRFGEERNQIGLSKWLRPHVQKDEGFGRAIGSLACFYKEARKQAEEAKKLTQQLPDTRRQTGVLLKYEDDTEEKEKELDVGMTNIAFIQAENQNGETGAIGSNDVAGSSLEGYVNPNRILARIDLKEAAMIKQRRQEDMVRVNRANANDSSNESAQSSLEALYNTSGNTKSDKKVPVRSSTPHISPWSGLQNSKSASNDKMQTNRKVVGVDDVDMAAKKERCQQVQKHSSVKEIKTTAADFFRRAKKQLSSDDFSAIRKLLVSMKSCGDKKDMRSYMRTARNLVAVLVPYDAKNSTYAKTHSLLDLLYPLLPPASRNEVEKFAIQLKFEESTFYTLCNENLPVGDFLVIKSTILPLLTSKDNFTISAKSGKRDPGIVLRDAKQLIEILLKYEGKVSKIRDKLSLLDSFNELIPSRHVHSVQALTDEMKASKRILRMRSLEQSQRGEESVDTALFYKRDLVSRTVKNQENESESTQENLESKRAMEAALIHAQEIQHQKRNRLAASDQNERKSKPQHRNPYINKRSKTASNEKLPTGQSPMSGTRHAPKMTTATVTTNSNSTQEKSFPLATMVRVPAKRGDSLTQGILDPVENMLRQVASDSYSKKDRSSDPGNILRKMKSNAPKDLVCTLCTKTSTQPFMANCGHHACLECWSHWLMKSQTCPVCRAPTEKRSLARIVFEQGTPPSFTQLCGSVEDDTDDDCSSEEGELEIIKK